MQLTRQENTFKRWDNSSSVKSFEMPRGTYAKRAQQEQEARERYSNEQLRKVDGIQICDLRGKL